jgi:hypothetical protein
MIICFFLGLKSGMATVSDSSYQIRFQTIKEKKTNNLRVLVSDSLPKENRIDTVLNSKNLSFYLRQILKQPKANAEGIISDEDFNEKSKLSNRLLALSLVSVFLIFPIVIVVKVIPVFSLLAIFASIVLLAISITFAAIGFKYSKAKIINFLLSLLGVVFGLIGLVSLITGFVGTY